MKFTYKFTSVMQGTNILKKTCVHALAHSDTHTHTHTHTQAHIIAYMLLFILVAGKKKDKRR